MKALITSAGLGTRLGKLTINNNKSLLKIGGRSLLEMSLSSLKNNAINDVVIITGHAYHRIEKEFAGKAKLIYNPFYRISGILPSIWLAKEYIGHNDFILITGDSIYHPSILEKCIKAKKDLLICVKQKKCKKDVLDCKVVTKNERLLKIGKKIKGKDVNGEFMGMLKVSKKSNNKFFNEIDRFLKEGRYNDYLSDVLLSLNNNGCKVSIFYTGDKPYIEVDTLEALQKARAAFT